MEFTERGGLEEGFAPVFHERVAPALLAIEGQRRERLRSARIWTALPLAAGVLSAASIFFGLGMGEGAAIGAVIVLVLGGVGSLVGRSWQTQAWTGSVAAAVMPAVCDHIGQIAYDRDASAGFPLGAARDLGLFGSYTSARLTDRLWGSHRDTEFEMAEAYLTRRTTDSENRSRTETVFNGLVFHIAVPVEAPTPILIARDLGALLNALGTWGTKGKGRGMPRVETGHEDFERAFEVHADDPDAARAFLPPLFLDNLLAIATSEGGSRGAGAMTASFRGQSFYLALSRSGDFLRMGSLSTPVTAMEDDLHAIFADIEIVHRIIDRLHGVA